MVAAALLLVALQGLGRLLEALVLQQAAHQLGPRILLVLLVQSRCDGISSFILITSSVAAMAMNSPALSRLMVCITSMCLMNCSVMRAIGMS